MAVTSLCTSGNRVFAASPASTACPALPQNSDQTFVASSETELRELARNAEPGTTILVKEGTYYLQSAITVVAEHVTIRGATGNRNDVIIDAGGMGTGLTNAIWIDANDATIADLTIRNTGEHGVTIQGVDRPTLYNLHILDTGAQMVKVNPAGDGSEDGLLACSRMEYTNTSPYEYTNGISAHNAHRWVVRDNEWYRIRTPDNTPAAAILFWSGSSETVVERNLLVNCYQGISFGNASNDSTGDHINGIVRNNFIYADMPHDTVIDMVHAAGWVVVHNTALLLDPIPGLTWGMESRYDESHGTFANNLTNLDILLRNGASADLTGNITDASPDWFVDPSAGDLHLLETAIPAIDQASATTITTDDFDGNPRPSNGTSDVGADEFDASTVTPETDSAQFLSIGPEDGWIREHTRILGTGQGINKRSTLVLGDDSKNRQFRTIVSFDTGSGLPDNAIITSITLKFKHRSITGKGDPIDIFEGILVQIKEGTFNTAALQSDDFQAAETKSIGTFKPALTDGWYSMDLIAGKSAVNLSGRTQLRLSFNRSNNNDKRSNFLHFFSGDGRKANRPILEIEYFTPW